jgi:SAM-dependent methyltransferase
MCLRECEAVREREESRVDVIEQHEIAEADHRILNPFTDEKLMLLGEVCRLRRGQRQLDLACGKGEMLARWAQRFGISGVGVDISGVFLAAARRRADELGVADRLEFVEADAGNFAVEPGSFDVVSCIGATWIGGGLAGTLELMRRPLRPAGLMLIGEPFWLEPPPAEAYAALECGPDDFASLGGTLDRFDAAGLELVEMVVADHDSWDRYVAAQWWTIQQWLGEHRSDPRAEEMYGLLVAWRRAHLEYGRRYLGWGVFVLR